MNKILILSLSVFLLSSCGKSDRYTLTGEVIPSQDGNMILFGFENGQLKPVDTTAMVGGTFEFKGDIEQPDLFLLSVEGKNQYIAQFFLEAGKTNITVYPDSFETNVITGSKSQELFQKYIDEMVSFTKNENEMLQRFRQSQAQGDEEEMEAIRFEYQTMMDNTQLYARNFIREYSSSPVAAYVYLMNFYEEAEIEELDSILALFEPIGSSQFVGAIRERADGLRASGVGSLAPEIALNDIDGNPFTLSQLKGKFVLVDFWASWCQPCLVEIPNLKEAYAQYKDKGFEILGVSLDREETAWRNAIASYELNWIHVWDNAGEAPGENANKYGVSGIPFTVLLDREGTIIAKNLRGSALEEKLAELLTQ
ncbi:MAG TPA: TlpA disulfide reductase family protein [Prolixibacteraceae bacterium]|nr:TlpA disulfide reductase family protein [Prolixibacteraceae bacterium]